MTTAADIVGLSRTAMMVLSTCGLTGMQFRVLSYLLAMTGVDGVCRVRQRVVASDLGVSASAVSSAVRGLERAAVLDRGAGGYVVFPGHVVVGRIAIDTALRDRDGHVRMRAGVRRAVEDRRSWASGWRADAAAYRQLGGAAMAALAARLDAMADRLDAEADRMVPAVA